MPDTNVPFLSLQREFDEYGDELLDRAHNVFERGQFILGNEVAAFEREFASHVAAKNGIGVNSGSDALHLALQAIGVDGKEVILPSHTFISTADAVVRNGGTPVFVAV